MDPNPGMYPKLSEEQFNLLGKLPDSELAKKVGLSRERIRQLRKKKNIPKFSKNKEKEFLLLNYIKNFNGELTLIDIVINTGIRTLNGSMLSISKLKTLCEKHNIKYLFKIDKKEKYTHNINAYRCKICKCPICKLANCLENWSFTHLKNVNFDFINQFANNYIDFYQNDMSRYKKNFYELFHLEFLKYVAHEKKA